ncbi:MAG: signal peptidase I [Rhodospirillaceae bacterium]|nr:signal peptidase I [Rhodospirillaceae bacterium]|tara:strand:- start:389 stop:1129 length:741 start_codon:yes stop_codon:yes gene_type:complete
MQNKKTYGIWDSAKTFVYAILIALLVRTVAFEPFNIPSGSMIPTLLIGDYLFVSKYSYGYSKHSIPLSLPVIPGRIFFSEPERGDVAVFKLPTDDETDYIKRLIGLPGDRIQMKSGRLYINGKIVERERIDDFVQTDRNGNIRRQARFLETLPNGLVHPILEKSDHDMLDDTSVYTVPPEHYFAMGDNRDNSQDSRVLSEVGFVPKKNLVGRAEVLFFSTNGAGRFWEVWKWPISIRFKRFFQGIT